MTIDDKIRDEKVQYDINREAAKISALSSGKIDRYGILEVNIWNHSRILVEFHWNTGGILPQILSKFTACFPELFR